MNFKGIQAVQESKELIDTIFSKTQRKTPTEIHPQYDIVRIRKFYMNKVRFTQQTCQEKLSAITS